jgi:hypothetical protein
MWTGGQRAMDDTTPTADQPALVIRHDLLDLWLRDACPPYTSRATRRAGPITASSASSPECRREALADAQYTE